MIVTLDGQKLEQSFEQDCTLQTLLDDVRDRYLGERLIVSVAVNGQILDDAALQRDLPAPVTETDQLDLESGDRVELVRNALIGLAEQFSDAKRKYADLADRLSAGETGAAVRTVGDFVGQWQMCHRAIAQCNGLLGRDLTECVVDGQDIKSWLEELIAKLGLLREALEAQDTVALADLIRYELLPLCDTWATVLQGLAREVKSGA